MARRGLVRQAGIGEAWFREARHGRRGEDRLGPKWHGRRGVFWTDKERKGAVWQAWPVVDGFGGARYSRCGVARHGEARQGRHGTERLGRAWWGEAGEARRGMEWRGQAGEAGRVTER